MFTFLVSKLVSFHLLIASYFRAGTLKSAWEEESMDSTDYKNWSEWKMESHSFDPKDIPGDVHSYPKAQLSGGRPWGMSFVVKQSNEDTVCPQFDGEGIRVRH
jgi:hypothetical protein